MFSYFRVVTIVSILIVSFSTCNRKKQKSIAQELSFPKKFQGVKAMLLLPGGEFSMGSESGSLSETPVHKVRLPHFYMDATPVTYNDFQQYVVAGGSVGPYWKYDTYNIPDQPITGVSWHHAINFCNWRSVVEGFTPAYSKSTSKDFWGYPIWIRDSTANGYRLPTEAEFEFAARGGLEQQDFPWGMQFHDSLANYDSEHGYHIEPWWRLAPIQSQQCNAYELYNMSGNVWQWCEDWYDSAFYKRSSFIEPVNNKGNRTKVLRGGSWGSVSPEYLKVFRRSFTAQGNYNYDIGFRCVRPIDCLRRDSIVVPDWSKAYQFVWHRIDSTDQRTINPITDYTSIEFKIRLADYLNDFWINSIYFQQRVDAQEKMTPRQLADTIIKVCLKNDVNPLFLTGIMVSESGMGTCSFPRWFNNPMAFFWQNKLMKDGAPQYKAIPNKQNRKFKTLGEGFDLFCKGIKNRSYYHKPASQDLYAFHKVYVGYEAEEWMLTLSRVYQDVAGIKLKPHEPKQNVGALIFMNWK